MATPHRYWRINIALANGASSYTSMSEVQLRDVVGGPDRTGSGTASASSAYSGYPASSAVDNTTATSWASFPNYVPQWWAYDFGPGVAYDIIEVVISARADGYPHEAPTDFTIEWSDNGADWTVAAHLLTTVWTGNGESKSFFTRTPHLVARSADNAPSGVRSVARPAKNLITTAGSSTSARKNGSKLSPGVG